jgi:hypothetical protein
MSMLAYTYLGVYSAVFFVLALDLIHVNIVQCVLCFF